MIFSVPSGFFNLAKKELILTCGTVVLLALTVAVTVFVVDGGSLETALLDFSFFSFFFGVPVPLSIFIKFIGKSSIFTISFSVITAAAVTLLVSLISGTIMILSEQVYLVVSLRSLREFSKIIFAAWRRT